MDGGHDSIVFFRVSVLSFFCAVRLSDLVVQFPDIPAAGRGIVLHIWSS